MLKQIDINKDLLAEVKEQKLHRDSMEELAGLCLGYLVDLFDDLVNLPEEISIKKPGYDMANFSFDSKDKCIVKKENYLQHKMATFIQEYEKAFSLFELNDKIMESFFKFESKQKESQSRVETEKIDNSFKKSTLKEQINVFKETLAASLNSSFSNHGSVLKRSNFSQQDFQSQPQPQVVQAQNEPKKPGFNAVKTNDFYKVLHDYKPDSDKDLSLRKGDIVKITRMFSNGWYKGFNIQTKEKGYVPSNFIKIMDESEISSMQQH